MIFLAFVVPVACYCLFLALINRGRHPVLISGPWDFAGILFAVSGFLLFGGPAALTGLHEQWRMSWLLGQARFLTGVGEQWFFWVGLWSAYFAVVVGGALAVFWHRRSESSIYNFDTATFGDVLQQVWARLKLNSILLGPQRILIHPREDKRHNSLESTSVLYHQPSVEMEWELFPAMRHVTLRWRVNDPGIRRDLEVELANSLRQVVTRDNPVGPWLLSLATCLFFLCAFGLCAVIILRILQLPGW